jgi:hypothetical protein
VVDVRVKPSEALAAMRSQGKQGPCDRIHVFILNTYAWAGFQVKGTPAATDNSWFFPSEYPNASTVHFELEVAGGLGPASMDERQVSAVAQKCDDEMSL